MRPAIVSVIVAALVGACAAAPRAPAPRAPAAPAPVAATPAPPAVRAPAEPPPRLQLPRDVRPLRYALALTVVPRAPRFQGEAEIEVQLDRPRQVIWLHGRDLHVTRSEVDTPAGRLRARYEQVDRDGVVRLTLPRPIGPGRATLRLAWDAAWGKVEGCFQSHAGGDVYVATQFESIYARRAFPGFDEPGFKTPFEVTLTVPTRDVAVSNTPVAHEEPGGAGLRRVRFAPTKPLPTYLVMWAVGPFDVVTPRPLPPNEVRARPLVVRGFAPRGRGAELAYALQAGGELLVALERYFGIPFPYEKLDHVAFVEFFGGAMENAGAITYQDDALLYKEGASPAYAKRMIATTLAHEIAHQWFGDLVTPTWWTDIWLNESFATWMGTRAVDAWSPALRAGIRESQGVGRVMEGDALAAARAIRQPLERMAEVEDQFDGMTYTKGGAVLAMFERWLGVDTFRRAVHDHLAAHAHGTAEAADFFAALQRASGRPVVTALRTFLDQPGAPLVTARMACDAKGARLEIEQTRDLPLGSTADRSMRWQVPVCARFGVGPAPAEACTLLAERAGAIPVPGGRCPDWVMPNADGAGYYRFALAPADLTRLRTAGYRHLTVRERLALVHSLRAALRSGAVDYADGLATLAPLARDAEPTVASEPMWHLGFVRDHLVAPALVPRVRAFGGELYRPVLRRLGWRGAPGEPLEQRQLREEVVSFLCFGVRDPAVRREAARLGRAWLGVADGRLHPEAVPPTLVETVVTVAAQDGDRKLYELLRARLRTTEDRTSREALLGALASPLDAVRGAQALALAFEPTLQKQEQLWPLIIQASLPERREATWREFQARFAAYEPLAVSWMRAHLPGLVAGGFCDARHADEVQAFFAAHLAQLPEARRSVAQTVERIRLCAAFADAQRASATRFFARRR